LFEVRSARWSRIPWLASAAAVVAGCGATAGHQTTDSRSTATTVGGSATASSPDELLAVPSVGRIYGRCAPGARRWTITFTGSTATDSVTYRIGSGRTRTLEVGEGVPAAQGGPALTLELVPGQFRSHEPADPSVRFMPARATTLKTTKPVLLNITQGTEPHIYRVKIRLALAAAIGDTTDCALISSSLTATTYYPGGQPPS
jgi:hypothetical protein